MTIGMPVGYEEVEKTSTLIVERSECGRLSGSLCDRWLEGALDVKHQQNRGTLWVNFIIALSGNNSLVSIGRVESKMLAFGGTEYRLAIPSIHPPVRGGSV